VEAEPSKMRSETTHEEDDLPPPEILESLASLEERGLLSPEMLEQFHQAADEVRSRLLRPLQ
jgi:hypothetical protein